MFIFDDATIGIDLQIYLFLEPRVSEEPHDRPFPYYGSFSNRSIATKYNEFSRAFCNVMICLNLFWNILETGFGR